VNVLVTNDNSIRMDDIKKMMQQMLTDNAAAAEAVVSNARAEREQVAAERAAAQEALLAAERDAQAMYDRLREQHRQRISKDLQSDLEKTIAERLLRAGEPVGEIAALLDVPDGMVKELALRLGYNTTA